MATRIQQRLRDERGAPERRRASPALKSVGVPDAPFAEEATVQLAHRMYELRRRRDAAFGADLFSEPGWDILLHLYILTSESGAICVSDACIGAAAPPTTALRRLRQLEEAGLIVRVGDPDDARRSYVRLSSKARRKLRKLLKGACPSPWIEP